LLAAVFTANAQDANVRVVSRYQVKPDRDGDFRAAVKEYVAVLKKAQPERAFTMWQSLTGAREYVLAAYHAKYGEMDIPRDPKLKEVEADLTGIGARIMQCVDHYERQIEEVLPEISLPRTPEPPAMIRRLSSQVRPDKVDAYIALLKSDLFPAVKKSGLKSFNIAQVRYGRMNTEFASVAGIAKYEDLDGQSPVVNAMGDTAYQAFLAKLRPLIYETRIDLYRFLPELSYMPSK
jgi:hypothetical protein